MYAFLVRDSEYSGSDGIGIFSTEQRARQFVADLINSYSQKDGDGWGPISPDSDELLNYQFSIVKLPLDVPADVFLSDDWR